MRRASYDKNSSSSVKRNFVSNQGYEGRSCLTTKTTTTKDVDCKRVNSCSLQASSSSSANTTSSSSSQHLQRSISADNVIVRSRGFKPSDRHDPAKRHFLEHLTSKILHFEMDSGEAKPIDLQKLLSPAMDSSDLLLAKHKKMYASSCFYAPTHPTVEDQVELARRISYSLSDVKNMKSKGQSMYVNRKKRSVKWIHDGNGDEGEEEPTTPMHKDKVPLKCMMNPNGKVMDIHGIQALGEEVNIGTSPSNAGKLFDIVRDLNNQKGRGAEIFAKRRKRSEKWVVDKEQCQTPTTPSGFTKAPSFPTKIDMASNENSKFTSLPPITATTPAPQPFDNSKPFYNPFTLDLSLESVTPSRSGSDQRRGSLQSEASMSTYNGEVKKIYLREVAVGTDPECPLNGDRIPMEKSKRMSFDSPNMSDHRHNGTGSSGMSRRSKSNGSGKEGHMNGHPRQEMGRRDRQSHQNPRHCHPNHQQYQQYDQYQSYDQQHQQPTENLPEDYTPVPVKQLIQEFEKTCRPVMQYKQMSPKIIPIHQQCPPLDNDISRFFETSRITTKYEDPQQQAQRETSGMIKRSSQSGKIGNGNGNMDYGNGNQAYPNGNGNQAYPHGNGNQTYPNGNGNRAYPNGNGGQAYPNGNGGQAYPNGNGGQAYPNGNGGQAYPNGNGGQSYPNGNGGQAYPNANPNQAYPNGNPNQAYANGNPNEAYPNGNPNQAYPNGNPNQAYPNGNPNQAYPNGNPNQAHPNGNPNQAYPNGNPNQAYPNGNPNQAYPNGNPNQAYPNGNPNQVYPNGNPNQAYPNGNPNQAYPNGHPNQVYPNGNPNQAYPKVNGSQGYPKGNGTQGYPNGNGTQGYPNGASNPACPNPTGNQAYPNGSGYANRSGFGRQTMGQQSGRYEEYDSTEDEIDDSFGESDDDEEVNYRRADGQRIVFDDESQSFNNDTRATSNGTMDEYEMYVRQFDESSELFEAPPGFRNGENADCDINGLAASNEPQSLVLAMVASKEDIRNTIKHLRNTPVLENLVGAPSPDFYADVGTNKVVEPAYQGPKIASYQTLTNYNTAPRGWDQSQTFYRPVTFGKQQEPIAYSDF